VKSQIYAVVNHHQSRLLFRIPWNIIQRTFGKGFVFYYRTWSSSNNNYDLQSFGHFGN